MSGWTLVIHGGAGILLRDRISADQDASTRAGLNAALDAGAAILSAGGSALDAVEASVRVLEDDPHFNAGRGAALTTDGVAELDAAIMEGTGRNAGAVAGVRRSRHPVSLARAVMEKSPHVLLAGEGADAFGTDAGIETASPDWFVIEERRRNLKDLLASNADAFDVDMKYGTVGAVACDRDGRLAAATSTGGVTGKKWGRVGDSPLPGAGTWADDRACAVSCTGAGEFFIRAGAGHEIAARARLSGEALADATRAVLADIKSLGGTGGIIVAGPGGEALWAFTTPGMNRGRITSQGDRQVAIYGDE